MAVNLKQIKSPLKNELNEFDSYFNNSLKSRIPLLDRIMKYMVRRKGKQMRPLLVIISAAICGKINEKTFRGATMIELLHTATLIHDDVVDDSMKRRGSFTINALWKNKTAVLVGDYLLSRGLLLALRNKDNDLLDITSEAVQLMSEGELLQIEKARTLDIKEEVYFDIIKMKTASLMASSCAIGAASVDASPDNQDKMKNLGLNLGIAFQIKDDLLDFKSNGTGKPKGGDLKEKN
jgi:octaprenyl-diphosphate synthase